MDFVITSNTSINKDVSGYAYKNKLITKCICHKGFRGFRRAEGRPFGPIPYGTYTQTSRYKTRTEPYRIKIKRNGKDNYT